MRKEGKKYVHDKTVNILPQFEYPTGQFSLISANNDWDFYYNVQNFPRIKLVFDTVDYFEVGARRGIFNSLDFLNLLWEQYNFVVTNIGKPHTVITVLKSLPLSPEHNHILLGLLLKWFGGCPINNMNKQFDTTLKLIQKEFLSYKGETPEKEFCQKDWIIEQNIREKEAKINSQINNQDYVPIELIQSQNEVEVNKLNLASDSQESLHVLPPQQTETKTDKLKVPQIALIHVYEGIQITRENAGIIAGKYGYTAKTSGEGLFQDYTTYCSTANRKGKPTPCTPKKLRNKIELFESVLIHLSNNSKQRAIDEINILKTLLENEYQ